MPTLFTNLANPQPAVPPVPQGAAELPATMLQAVEFGKALRAAGARDLQCDAVPQSAAESDDEAPIATATPDLLAGGAMQPDIRVLVAATEPAGAGTAKPIATDSPSADAALPALVSAPLNPQLIGMTAGLANVAIVENTTPATQPVGQGESTTSILPGVGTTLTCRLAVAPTLQQPSAVPPASVPPVANRPVPAVPAPTSLQAQPELPPSAATQTSIDVLPVAPASRRAAPTGATAVAATIAGGGGEPAELQASTSLPQGAPLVHGGNVVSGTNGALPVVPKTTVASVDAAGQRLMAALGERISVQVQQGVQSTTIRLDPPLLGSVEISIRHEGGALQVHLTASSAEVVQQLQAVSDGLRQDLGGRQYTQVAVQVAHGERSTDARDGQGQRQAPAREDKPGRALAEAEEGHERTGFRLG